MTFVKYLKRTLLVCDYVLRKGANLSVRVSSPGFARQFKRGTTHSSLDEEKCWMDGVIIGNEGALKRYAPRVLQVCPTTHLVYSLGMGH